jgi:hypothetical protein
VSFKTGNIEENEGAPIGVDLDRREEGGQSGVEKISKLDGGVFDVMLLPHP